MWSGSGDWTGVVSLVPGSVHVILSVKRACRSSSPREKWTAAMQDKMVARGCSSRMYDCLASLLRWLQWVW